MKIMRANGAADFPNPMRVFVSGMVMGERS